MCGRVSLTITPVAMCTMQFACVFACEIRQAVGEPSRNRYVLIYRSLIQCMYEGSLRVRQLMPFGKQSRWQMHLVHHNIDFPFRLKSSTN